MRLFVALKLPQDMRHALVALMGGLEHARWQDENQLHMSLRFIGEVDDHIADDIVAALRTIHHSPVTLKLRGVNIFGKPRTPRILWAGVEPNPGLASLHERINQALNTVGLEDERRNFVPHVTLARFPKHKRVRRVPAYLETYSDFRWPPLEAHEFHLFRSHLGHGGAKYDILESFPLEKPLD